MSISILGCKHSGVRTRAEARFADPEGSCGPLAVLTAPTLVSSLGGFCYDNIDLRLRFGMANAPKTDRVQVFLALRPEGSVSGRARGPLVTVVEGKGMPR
jgi:hypothetical protein